MNSAPPIPTAPADPQVGLILAEGYTFRPALEGRVQLIAPDGEPLGSFATAAAAARSVFAALGNLRTHAP